jgi:hypothetical protein
MGTHRISVKFRIIIAHVKYLCDAVYHFLIIMNSRSFDTVATSRLIGPPVAEKEQVILFSRTFCCKSVGLKTIGRGLVVYDDKRVFSANGLDARVERARL